jgi:hypothetical protein
MPVKEFFFLIINLSSMFVNFFFNILFLIELLNLVYKYPRLSLKYELRIVVTFFNTLFFLKLNKNISIYNFF